MYIIARGECRLVVAIPGLGIAIKLPRLLGEKEYRKKLREDFASFTLELGRTARRPHKYTSWHWVFFTGRQLRKTFMRQAFFQGSADNWRERRFYKHCNPIARLLLQPTHFSLLGLLNIQRCGVPCSVDRHVMKNAFAVCIGVRLMLSDGHHFNNPANFGQLEPYPKFLDYGSKSTQELITEGCWALFTAFSLADGLDNEKVQRAYRAWSGLE